MTERASDQGSTRFWQRSADYHGVLSAVDGWRVAVSPNGTRYLLQRSDGEAWDVARWRKSLALLLPDIRAASAALADEVERLGLPDDPQSLARPWAGEVERSREHDVAATLTCRSSARRRRKAVGFGMFEPDFFE